MNASGNENGISLLETALCQRKDVANCGEFMNKRDARAVTKWKIILCTDFNFKVSAKKKTLTKATTTEFSFQYHFYGFWTTNASFKTTGNFCLTRSNLVRTWMINFDSEWIKRKDNFATTWKSQVIAVWHSTCLHSNTNKNGKIYQ